MVNILKFREDYDSLNHMNIRMVVYMKAYTNVKSFLPCVPEKHSHSEILNILQYIFKELSDRVQGFFSQSIYWIVSLYHQSNMTWNLRSIKYGPASNLQTIWPFWVPFTPLFLQSHTLDGLVSSGKEQIWVCVNSGVRQVHTRCVDIPPDFKPKSLKSNNRWECLSSGLCYEKLQPSFICSAFQSV